MRILENNGYQNVAGLKRAFAIEVDEYDEKEIMLHAIFEKSRVSYTELFALDVNLAIQLLSSFDGEMIYPKNETKNDIFEGATVNSMRIIIPDGTYTLQKEKKSDYKNVHATAEIHNGCWTLKKGSMLGITEDKGVTQKARAARASMQLDSNGILLEDFDLGECYPSHAAVVVLNQSINGWDEWKNSDGQPVSIYRKKSED